MNKKLRLKITDKCQRNCDGCCNKDFPEVKKFDLSTASQYEEVYITGGEPLLAFRDLRALLALFNELGVAVFIYSSMCNSGTDALMWSSLIYKYSIAGITFTIHEESHIEEFQKLDYMISNGSKRDLLSLRLNKFDHFDMEYTPLNNWKVRELHWLKNCPIPKGEDFRCI